MPREIRHRNCVFLLCMQKRSFSVTCRFAPQAGELTENPTLQAVSEGSFL
jgi:hypothetical protein